MKVLVLGSTGQLGANVVRSLLERGHEVRAFHRPGSRTVGIEGLPVEAAQGDVRDPESLHRALEGCRGLMDAASYYPTLTVPAEAAVREGLAHVRNVMEAARRASVERVVFTSALTTIGPPAEPGAPADETCAFKAVYPENPYLAAKAAMEDEVRRRAGDGLPAVIVNPTTFLGPYDSRPSSGTQILMMAKGLMPAYIEGRTNVVDVRDVAAGMVGALERGRVGERYILGHWNTTQGELNRLIARVLGVSPPRLRAPYELARWGSKAGEWAFTRLLRRPPPVPAFFVEVLGQLQHYDSSKALRELGLPQSPVETAVRDAVNWFREHGYL